MYDRSIYKYIDIYLYIDIYKGKTLYLNNVSYELQVDRTLHKLENSETLYATATHQ